ncbi:MAG TPA: isocitrate lyase/phosphoenolpyruvate mutase family protein [Gemmatimonadales bacterium]|nr:isocitrate lyase/phosphoenolpyruvate mutase family protein [Gemmatimonadales bacterium]
MTHRDLALAFRKLHPLDHGSILVLPNAWDAMSARIIEEAGAQAIATTSCGVSWSLGRRDGEGLSREEMIEAVRRIVSAVDLPVTADLESGYGNGSLEDVVQTVQAVIEAGAVGINLEDSPGRDGQPLLETAQQAQRIAAARGGADATGIPLFVNARIDVYLRRAGTPDERLNETVWRARTYLAAGADGIFVPGVTDPATIERLAREVKAPLNIMAGPQSPGIVELRQLGVSRVSLGPALTLAAMAHIRRATQEVLWEGTYEHLAEGMTFPEADGLFEPPSAALGVGLP